MLKTLLMSGLMAMAATFSVLPAQADESRAGTPAGTLAGTWTLVAADVIRADGTRAHDYGAAPKGLLVIDRKGRYALQIFKSERAQFASGDKSKGTPAEYESAVMGSSTHYGSIDVDQPTGTITFKIEGASFPNWEGQQQKRKFELVGNQLSYGVPARPDGSRPISVWMRID